MFLTAHPDGACSCPGRLISRLYCFPGALWRSRSVPRWLAALFVIGLYVAEYQSSGGAIVVLYMLPFAAAMALLAARIWQAAAQPASQPQPEPASVPA